MSNHPINHVGIHVPDLSAAIAFYTKHFGFRELRPPMSYDRSATPDAPIFRIYDNKLHKVKIAFLQSSNGIGFELFQFIDPPMSEPAQFDYTKGGVFHVAITDPDPEALAERVVMDGGKRVGEPIVMEMDGVTVTALYVQDPWANGLEVCSLGFEEMILGPKGS